MLRALRIGQLAYRHRNFHSSTKWFQEKQVLGQIERKLQITFTCTAPVPIESQPSLNEPCHHRSTHTFNARSYEKGIVLIECPKCKNRHLIADNLDWFSSTPSPGNPDGVKRGTKRTIEDLMREKGEQVRWDRDAVQGSTWEVSPSSTESSLPAGQISGERN